MNSELLDIRHRGRGAGGLQLELRNSGVLEEIPTTKNYVHDVSALETVTGRRRCPALEEPPL